MPAIGPVYQPTTYNIGYMPQTEWPQNPRRSRCSRLMELLQSKECCRLMFILFSIFFIGFAIFITVFKLGVILHSGDFVMHGGLLWLTLLILMVIACIVSLSMWYVRRTTSTKQFTWPWFVRKEGLVRQMNNQNRNGQNMVLNPSTDLLVTSAQYGPVVEAPPVMHEEDETRNLMGNENKEINDDTEDRALDPDPRIVLRPPGHREEA